MFRLKHYSVIQYFIVIEFKYLYLKVTILSPDLKEGWFNKGFSATHVDEFILIDISHISCSLGWTNKSQQNNLTSASVIQFG